MRKLIVPLVFGVVGCAILVSLAVWQLKRHVWKQDIFAQIEARIEQPPVILPANPDSVRDKYLPVEVSGDFDGNDLTILIGLPKIGPRHRLIASFETEDGRRILVDRGWVAIDPANRTKPEIGVRIIGNLHWPDEVDSWTPAPDQATGTWFARDVPAMAKALDTEPVLVVAKSMSGNNLRTTPLPVTTAGIPNSHLGYAIQWFGLAIVWAGMTAFLIWRIHRRTV